MGKELFETNSLAKEIFAQANEILGYHLTDVMFNGTEEEIKQTKIAQPAIFVHSVIMSLIMGDKFKPDMVAGHSLGETSALVANKSLKFEDALKLVYKRAMSMQRACELQPSAMAAVLGLDDQTVEKICSEVEDMVVAANYNCPAQVVISGTNEGINKACERMKQAGAKRTIVLNVGGAFHSPLMEPARKELEEAINETNFNKPVCPIYQNVNALPFTDPEKIKQNLVAQLTAPVYWTQTIQNMVADGATSFAEVGPGKVLQAMVKKICRDVEVMSA
jgi:[acyl-carrier-protein] S-malonyltransferase